MKTELPLKLKDEARAMRGAIAGECVDATFHLLNWADKPHRVVYDACNHKEEAAARVEELELALVEITKVRLRMSDDRWMAAQRCIDIAAGALGLVVSA